jgi:hypothetical protein
MCAYVFHVYLLYLLRCTAKGALARRPEIRQAAQEAYALLRSLVDGNQYAAITLQALWGVTHMISHLPLKWNPPIQEVVSCSLLVHVIVVVTCGSVVQCYTAQRNALTCCALLLALYTCLLTCMSTHSVHACSTAVLYAH